MKDWEKTLVSPSSSIVDTLKIIDSGAMQIALVVDEDNRLLGTVTDGDVRRCILKGISLESPVTEIMKKTPVVATVGQTREDILKMMRNKGKKQIPVVDQNGCVVGLELLDELLQTGAMENWVVIMAGGLGTRLKPLTDHCPKPMVKIGSKPLLETILNSFIDQGFSKFFIAVNYMAEIIKKHFGDGSQWGVEINYLTEEKKMGTAGALGLLPEKPDKPLLVMNGDLLTKVNYKQLLDYHSESRAVATMCVREYSFQLPYGVIKIENGRRIREIEEKPVHHFFVNAGIYVLEPQVLQYLPADTCIDMTTLFERIIEQKLETSVFPIREYWIDIGYHEELERANAEFDSIFESTGGEW